MSIGKVANLMAQEVKLNSSSSHSKNISETAHLVAMYRALETERPDALIQDPFARLLAGALGEALMEMLGDKQNATNALAIRTRVIDELILWLVESKRIDTVLNLGAGLDTRPYRLTLPASLHWIEVDLPAILSYKEQKLENEKPSCLLELVKLDLGDINVRNALFSRVNTEAKQVLVITEGLLVYLLPEQVASLAADLHMQSNFRWWLFELMSSFTLQQSRKYQVQKIFDQYFAAGNATLLFAPEEGSEFFRRYGWQVAQLRSAWEESRRLKREIRFAWFLKVLIRWFAKERWETFSQRDGIVLLERL